MQKKTFQTVWLYITYVHHKVVQVQQQIKPFWMAISYVWYSAEISQIYFIAIQEQQKMSEVSHGELGATFTDSLLLEKGTTNININFLVLFQGIKKLYFFQGGRGGGQNC